MASAVALIELLGAGIQAGELRGPTRLCRGIRDLADLRQDFAEHGRATLVGFVATTLDPSVTHQFIPQRGGILALDAPAGLPALDVARSGTPRFADQKEILLADGLQVEFVKESIGRAISTDPRLADRLVIEARIVHDQPLF